MKTIIVCALFALNLLAATAHAGWSFTAKTFTSGCVGGAPTYTIPFPSEGLPTRSMCESTRAQILAIRYSGPNGYGGTCTVGYTCTPCAGFDDPKSGAGEAGGTFNASGSVQGRASFASNGNTEAVNWEQETRDRLERLGKSTLQQSMAAPSTGDPAFDQGYQQQMQAAYGGEEFMPKKKKPRKAPARGSSAWRSQQGTTYEAGDERTTEDEPRPDFRPAGTDEAAQAQPQGGVGLTQGEPDKAPPPNPESAKSKGRCRDRNWWYSSKTGNCYYSKESCEAAALHQGTCEQSL